MYFISVTMVEMSCQFFQSILIPALPFGLCRRVFSLSCLVSCCPLGFWTPKVCLYGPVVGIGQAFTTGSTPQFTGGFKANAPTKKNGLICNFFLFGGRQRLETLLQYFQH